VPALVRPPAEPLCAHPGGYPTPNTLPTASTSTVPQQGKAGVQVLALVQPPTEPLCAHPGGYPTPNTPPTTSTSTVLQQGKAGVQVPALVPPPSEPLCAHPGSYPTPSTAFHFVHKNVCLTLSVYWSGLGSEPP